MKHGAVSGARTATARGDELQQHRVILKTVHSSWRLPWPAPDRLMRDDEIERWQDRDGMPPAECAEGASEWPEAIAILPDPPHVAVTRRPSLCVGPIAL